MQTTKILCLMFLQLVTPKPLVYLPNLGEIRGQYTQTYAGRTIFSFEGVPYAQPPVGPNRFKAPEPVKPWKGTIEANIIYRCMQYYQYTPPGQDYVIGDENCLFLNIYTPKLDQNSTLDVLVYIHGGSFMFNYGGLYRPDYLLDKNVVLVTLNYRLGPLGFLSTEDDTVAGNNGLKDQILALEFVKTHAKYFGGNANSITIFGNSAGGVSVHLHYLSPKSRGLFHRGLSLSGCSLEPWALMEKPLGKTKQLAAAVGCLTENTTSTVDCLRTRPARQIVSTVKLFQPWLYIPFSPFGPVVDGWSRDPVLPQHPYVLLKNKHVYDVPWVVSYTSSEGLYPAEEFYQEHLEDVEDRWNELIPLILDYNYTVEGQLRDEVSQKIRQHYLGDKKLTRSTFRDFVPVLSERLFVNDIQKAARLHASASSSPVYAYKFAYRGRNSWFMFESEDGEDFGVAHADDLQYFFKLGAIDGATTQNDRHMVKFYVDLVTFYAQTNKPQVPIEWVPLSKDRESTFRCLKIASSTNLSFGDDTSKNYDFWASLPIAENEKLFPELEEAP